MTEQTRAALQNASVVFFMVDARTGITPMDLHFFLFFLQIYTHDKI